MGLPKLNSVESCEKCGAITESVAHGSRADMEYVAARTADRGSAQQRSTFECMIRTCWRCGFQWSEAVLERTATDDRS